MQYNSVYLTELKKINPKLIIPYMNLYGLKKNPESKPSGFSAISIVYKKYSEFSKHIVIIYSFLPLSSFQADPKVLPE